uniref:Uncharacterized protein n=1 Tax=viral metagenome TaxID=1070528 RepID=A0A6C0IAT4_9ZZZZ
MQIVALFLIFVWLMLYGTVFEAPYPKQLVELHALPLWRLVLVILVLVAANWCPRVGLYTGLAVFFYLADLEKLTTPFVPIVPKAASG